MTALNVALNKNEVPRQFDFKYHLKPIKYHTEPDGKLAPTPEGFYEVLHPIAAFKKGYSRGRHDAIVNLIIPAGAHLFIGVRERGDGVRRSVSLARLDSNGEMRASHAYVHSIVRYDHTAYWRAGAGATANHKQIQIGYSWWQNLFCYRTGEMAVPTNRDGFSYEESECSPGIHFFLDVRKAIAF